MLPPCTVYLVLFTTIWLLQEEGLFQNISLDEEQEERLTQLLDIFVIRLEGGSQTDVDAFLGQAAAENVATDAAEAQVKSPRTSSIFFKALPPSVTRAELAGLCGRYPGFIRVAIAEPAITDRRMARRGWATFTRSAKVREICFSMVGSRLRGWELAPVINKDLTKRIRAAAAVGYPSGSGDVSLHDRRVVRSDLRLASKLVAGLDSRRGLWPEGGEGVAGNPLLRSVQDYLVEEVSYTILNAIRLVC